MSPPEITAPGAPRPAVPVSLVVLDLDGTCLDAGQRLHPRTREAVRRLAVSGPPVIIATGRMYRSALPWALELDVGAPILCYQGAVVRALPEAGARQRDGVPQGALVFEDALPARTAIRGLHRAREGGWHRQAYQDDRLLCEEDRPELALYARIAQVPVTFVDDLEPLLARGTTKLVCVVDDEAGAAACEVAMAAALTGSARVTRSLPPFIEVTNPVASKGRALVRLCERLGLDPHAGVAVGDAPNDIDLLGSVGFAVAVRDARPEVLAAAAAICAPPEEAGVATLLEALGLG